MRRVLVATLLACSASFFLAVEVTHAAPCMLVTVTGAMGGPPNFNGMAGPGTLVRYGDDSNDCGAVKMQFDAGRATSVRLSQLGVTQVS